MRKTITVLFIILAGVGAGCEPAPANAIVLQAGDFVLTEDAFQALRGQGAYRDLTDAQLAERLVTEARIMAFALQHRYDTLSQLQRQLDYAVRYQVSSVNGYLWNRTVKPSLRVSPDEIKKAYALRAQEYWLEYSFYTAQDTQTFSGWRSYPFVPLAVYLPALALPETGKSYGPVKTLHGYCIVHVKEKRPARVRAFSEDSAAINGELLLALQEDKIWRSQEQVLQTTHPLFYDAAIDSVAAAFDPSGQTWAGVDMGLVLMEYTWQGKLRRFTLASLQELVQCQPLYMGSLQRAGDVKKLLESFLIGICLYEQAKGLGMEADPVFQLQKQQYLRGIYIQRFRQSYVHPRLSVSDKLVVEAYHRQQSPLRCFDKARVAWYDFADLPSALQARQSLLDGSLAGQSTGDRTPAPKADTISIAGNDTLLGKALFDAINRVQPGGLSMPVQEGKRFVVLRVLQKEGSIRMPLPYAADLIRQQLLAAQEQVILGELASLFPIQKNGLGDFLAVDGR